MQWAHDYADSQDKIPNVLRAELRNSTTALVWPQGKPFLLPQRKKLLIQALHCWPAGKCETDAGISPFQDPHIPCEDVRGAICL